MKLIFEKINKNRTHLGLIWRFLVKKCWSSLSSDFKGYLEEGFSLKTGYFSLQDFFLEVKQNNDAYFGVKK